MAIGVSSQWIPPHRGLEMTTATVDTLMRDILRDFELEITGYTMPRILTHKH